MQSQHDNVVRWQREERGGFGGRGRKRSSVQVRVAKEDEGQQKSGGIARRRKERPRERVRVVEEDIDGQIGRHAGKTRERPRERVRVWRMREGAEGEG